MPNLLSAVLLTTAAVFGTNLLEAQSRSRPTPDRQFATPGNAFFAPEQTTADYGRGYDALRGEVLPNRCLQYNSEDDLSPKPKTAQLHFYLTQLKQESDFATEFNVSA